MESLVQLALKRVTLQSLLESTILDCEIQPSLRQQLESLFTYENIINEHLYNPNDNSIQIDPIYLERIIPKELIDITVRSYIERKDTLLYLHDEICNFLNHPGQIILSCEKIIFWEIRETTYYLYELSQCDHCSNNHDSWQVKSYSSLDQLLRHPQIMTRIPVFGVGCYINELDDESRKISRVLGNNRHLELDQLWEKLRMRQVSREWSSMVSPSFLKGSQVTLFVIQDYLYLYFSDHHSRIDIYHHDDGFCILSWYLWTSEEWNWDDHPFIQGQWELPFSKEEAINPLQ